MSKANSEKEWHGRGYPQYDAEMHIPLLHKVFGECGGIEDFCAEAIISKRTFQTWRYKHPEFQEQYEIAICKGAAIWLKKPLEVLTEMGVTLNHNYWVAIARNRYRFSQNSIEKEKEDTTISKMDAAWESLKIGGITPQEFSQIASGLATESRIEEVDLQKQALEHEKESAIPKEVSDEALRAYMLVKSGKGKVIEVGEDK